MTGTRIGEQQQSATIQDLSTKVQALTSPGPAFEDPISQFTLQLGPNPSSVQIGFRAAFTTGLEQIHIHRGLTRDFGTAIGLASFPAAILDKPASYTDADASLSGKKVWYWLHIHPSNAANAPIVHPPQSINVP